MSASELVTVVSGRLEPLVAMGLSVVLSGDRQIQVLESDLDYSALERAVGGRLPRVAIVDEQVDYGLLARLQRAWPSTGLLVLANAPERLYGTMLLAEGVTCLPRTASPSETLEAVHLAAKGEPRYFSSEGRVEPNGRTIDARLLTRREREVFEFLRRGCSYSEIAGALQLAYETARTHSRNVCRKANVESRVGLIGMDLVNS
jgi:DNA-binding NarL/FixJ family response regulator